MSFLFATLILTFSREAFFVAFIGQLFVFAFVYRKGIGFKKMAHVFGAVILIARESKLKPHMLQQAPHRTPVKRVDALKAARNPVIVCNTCCT